LTLAAQSSGQRQVWSSAPIATHDERGQCVIRELPKWLAREVRRSLFGRKYFLNADLVNKMRSAQVCQMRPFFVIRQVSTNAVDHHHNERTVIHIEPVRTADKLIGSISCERTINILPQVG
jgi:hypothetical protein